tara:strand:- start:385 stop:906 length:522 start_codon:yes stop_codon:yes gene_type:complete
MKYRNITAEILKFPQITKLAQIAKFELREHKKETASCGSIDEDILDTTKDIQKARITSVCNIKLSVQIYEDLKSYIKDKFGYTKVAQSGGFVYPVGGYMGWHTNSDNQGMRIYITYTEEGGKSYFDYVDNDKIIETPDKKGITARMFKVEKDNLFWHRVRSKTPRYSIGFICL